MATECAYCGSPDAKPDDHIPAKSIYKPGVNAPPKVKSCAACNNGSSDDDEYFRDVLLKHYMVADLPEAAQQVAAMFRAAKLPAKKGYTTGIVKSFVTVEARTPSGLYLGKKPAYSVDRERVRRVLSRYVRGLHRLTTGERLPESTPLMIIENPEELNRSQAEIEAAMQGAEVTVVQEGVFWYARQPRTGHPDTTAWLLVFFDRVAFFIIAGGPGPAKDEP